MPELLFLIPVPAHAKPVACPRCACTIYRVIVDGVGLVDVDCSVEGGRAPVHGVMTGGLHDDRDGAGVSHVMRCEATIERKGPGWR